MSESMSTYAGFFVTALAARAGALRAGMTAGASSSIIESSLSLSAALDFAAAFFAGGFELEAFRAVGTGFFGTLSKKSVKALEAFFFFAGAETSSSLS
jgi:hypothetical protein